MVRLVLPALLLLVHINAACQQTLGGVKRNVLDIALRAPMMGIITDDAVELWNIQSRTLLASIPAAMTGRLTAVAFGDDFYTLVTGSDKGQVTAWKMTAGASIEYLAAGNQGAVTSLDASCSGRFVAASFANHRVMVFQQPDGAQVYSFDGLTADATAVSFAIDETTLASGSADGTITIHNILTNKTLPFVKDKWIRAMTFNKEGNKLIAASNGDMVTLQNKSGSWENAMETIDNKLLGNWITSVDASAYNSRISALSTLSGKVLIMTDEGTYHYKMKGIVNRIKLLPSYDKITYIAVATRGQGLVILSAAKMNLSRK